MKLHEAIVETLRAHGRAMTAKEIAQYINAHGLYTRRDGAPVPANQIQARIHRPEYRGLFTIDASTSPQRIGLRRPVDPLERALVISTRLHEIGKRMRQREMKQDPLLGVVLGALGARLFQAHWSIQLLAVEGLSADAGTVLRAMIEGVVRLRWIAKCGREEAEKYLASSIVARKRLLARLKSVAKSEREREQLNLDLLEERVRSWEAQLSRQELDQAGSATKIDVFSKAKEVGLPDAEWHYELYSWDVHSTAAGTEKYVRVHPENEALFGFYLGAGFQEAARILSLANLYLLVTLETLNQSFALGMDSELQELDPTTHRAEWFGDSQTEEA